MGNDHLSFPCNRTLGGGLEISHLSLEENNARNMMLRVKRFESKEENCNRSLSYGLVAAAAVMRIFLAKPQSENARFDILDKALRDGWSSR